MTVTVYRSTDGSAPVLDGTAGSLITVLDAVLVNGYGAKGAVGWTKAFSGTNVASYRQPITTTNYFYLDVNDDNPNSDTNKTARISGYETMSAIATGTGQFPTSGQNANALQCTKSTEASTSTAVLWVIVATNKMFYMWVRPISTLTGAKGDVGPMWGFGDFLSYKTADIYNTCIIGNATAGASSSSTADYQLGTISTNGVGTAQTNIYIARSHTQTGTSITAGKVVDTGKTGVGSAFMGYNGTPTQMIAYPNGPDSSLYTSPVWLYEAATSGLRGILPGIYAPLHDRPLNTADTFTGAGGSSLAGKTLEAFCFGISSTASLYGQLFLETSDTW